MQPPPQPTRPPIVEGWKESYDKESGVRYCAVLLLKKGESTDNGRFGVKVLDIIEAESCCGDRSSRCYRRAKFQFYRPINGHILCEFIVTETTNHVIECSESLGVSVVGTGKINTLEGWVLFDLRC